MNCAPNYRFAPVLAALVGSLLGGFPLPAAAAPSAKPARKPSVAKPSAPAGPAPSAKAAPKPDAPKPAAKPAPKPDTSVAFFRDGLVPRLKIEIAEPELQKLRGQEREYVRCAVTEDGRTRYEGVGIHLKGAAGSFRGVDDRPALTLKFDKYKDDQAFHDLDKIHLNNSVQDASYLNELICSELMQAAGVPAARVSHARVSLNGRDLGLYVLMEGFDKDFLRRHSLDPAGNLYEGGFCRDMDQEPRLQSGDGPADLSDVKAVAAACREGDPAKRWAAMAKTIDIDRFLSFMAMELLTCHWDGYCQQRNNYRFYFDPKSGRLQFFPHGMDQMFSDPNFPVLNAPGAMVASSVMANPEWRGRYRDRLTELIKLFVPPDRLLARVEAHHQRLRPVLAEIGPGPANDFDNQVRALNDRLAARGKSLAQQVGIPEPRPAAARPAPRPGPIAQPAGWEPRMETPDAKLEKLESAAGAAKMPSLSITAGPSGRCVASWRTRVTLPAGKYRFEGRARAQGIKALQEPSGTGAGLRISGSQRTNKLDGTAGWTPLAHEFQIDQPMQEVELVAELRATAGQVLFDAASLRLVRVSK